MKLFNFLKTISFISLTVLFLTVTLNFIQPPNQVHAKTWTINIYKVKHANGSFEKVGSKSWVEKNNKGKTTFHFYQQNKTKTAILLFDKSRQVHISLIIPEKTILYSHKGKEFQTLYKITKIYRTKKHGIKKPKIKCGKNYKFKNGECHLQQNCGAHAYRTVEGDCFCKKNYESKAGKCIWKTDKNGFEIAPWKKPECKELTRLCKRGINKACMQFEEICQVN